MTSQDWFTLVLRSLGVWRAITALEGFVGAFNIATKLQRSELWTAESYFTQSVMDVFVALILLFIAPRISAFFYQRRAIDPAPPPAA